MRKFWGVSVLTWALMGAAQLGYLLGYTRSSTAFLLAGVVAECCMYLSIFIKSKSKRD